MGGWGKYNVVMELKHEKPKIIPVRNPFFDTFWSFK